MYNVASAEEEINGLFGPVNLQIIPMTSQPSPLKQVAEEIALLSRELSYTGGLIFACLEKPMESLKAGRAPRTLGLSVPIQQAEELNRSALEILDELRAKSADFGLHAQKISPAPFGELIRSTEHECAFWQAFCQRSQILLKKLALIAELEKLSPLGRTPILDAWEEVRALAIPPTQK